MEEPEREIIAFYRTPATKAQKSRKLVSRMRISPEVVEIGDEQATLDAALADRLKDSIIKSIAEKAGDVDSARVEFWYHEFMKYWFKDEDGLDEYSEVTLFKCPLVFN